MADPFLAELGLRIKGLRESRGLTRAGLGEASGTNHVTILRIEEGRNPTNILLLKNVCVALRIELRDLFPDDATPAKEFAARTIPDDLLESLARAKPMHIATIRQVLLGFGLGRELMESKAIDGFEKRREPQKKGRK